MPTESIFTPPAAAPATVSFTVDDALAIANTVAALVSALNPAVAGTLALATGAAGLLRNTVMPAIQHLQTRTMDIVGQATLAAESAVERARVGAPPATIN